MPSDSGIYCLWISLKRPARIRVGRLGRFQFLSGYYAYIGSAQRGLRARIARHERKSKRLRWHIDFLLARARVVRVEVWRAGREEECRLALRVGGLPGAQCVIRRFGASDCRCPTHLWFLGNRPRIRHYRWRKTLDNPFGLGEDGKTYRGVKNRIDGGIAHGTKAEAPL